MPKLYTAGTAGIQIRQIQLHQSPDSAVPRVTSIQVGRIAPLTNRAGRSVPSGFVKTPVQGPIEVGPLGLFGDQQADLTVHGGVDKAVYFYPSEHYPCWVKDAPRHEQMLVAGAFGENLTTAGLNEESVSVGQIFRIGSVELQVTQPRQPCFKLAIRFDDATLGRLMMQTGRTGWYTRVLKAGVLQGGDPIRTIEEPSPGLTIASVTRLTLRRDRS